MLISNSFLLIADIGARTKISDHRSTGVGGICWYQDHKTGSLARQKSSEISLARSEFTTQAVRTEPRLRVSPEQLAVLSRLRHEAVATQVFERHALPL